MKWMIPFSSFLVFSFIKSLINCAQGRTSEEVRVILCLVPSFYNIGLLLTNIFLAKPYNSFLFSVCHLWLNSVVTQVLFISNEVLPLVYLYPITASFTFSFLCTLSWLEALVLNLYDSLTSVVVLTCVFIWIIWLIHHPLRHSLLFSLIWKLNRFKKRRSLTLDFHQKAYHH